MGRKEDGGALTKIFSSSASQMQLEAVRQQCLLAISRPTTAVLAQLQRTDVRVTAEMLGRAHCCRMH